ETAKVLKKSGAKLDKLKAGLEKILDAEQERLPEGASLGPQPTRGFERVLEQAAFHMQSSGQDELSGEDVLVSIFAERDSSAVALLHEAGTSRLDVVNYISHRVTKSGSEQKSLTPSHTDEDEEPEENPLERFATHLNERARQGEIEPLVGREKEVRRTIQVLARRRKNNPLLVGDAGVGKTAIVEGLAAKVVEGDVPDALKDAEIYALDMGSLVAGTKF